MLKTILKRLFCWHHWVTTFDDPNWMYIERKCTKCGAEQVNLTCPY